MLTKTSVVTAYHTSPKSLVSDVGKAIDTAIPSLDLKRATYIKINANYDRNWPGCNTSEWFLRAVLTCLRDRGFSEVSAIEGDLKLQPAATTIKCTGIDQVLEEFDVPFLSLENLNRIDELPALLQDSQLISTPVLHTHTFARISVATKNLFGLLPVYREQYHNNLSQKLIELAKKVTVFSLVDATVGLEGGSMRMGTPVRMDMILAGWNPIAVDVVSARIMGFAVEDVPYLKLAQEKGLLDQITVVGDFTYQNLPERKFKYSTSILATLDLLIRATPPFSSWFKYGEPVDELANRARRAYTSAVYRRRIKSVQEGPWRDYPANCGRRQ